MEISNEERARRIAEEYSRPYGLNSDSSIECYQSANEAMKWKEQQIIDKAMKVICDGCAQKVECEFNNWKTCSTKDELIKSIKGE